MLSLPMKAWIRSLVCLIWLRPRGEKWDQLDSLLVISASQPKEKDNKCSLQQIEDNLQFGQCGSEAEQSQTVASAVMISGCVVQLPYFPPPLSPSLNRTQRLSAAAVAGMIKQDLLVILSPSLLPPQRQVRSTSERSESRRACELCQR